ncbi:riboflavin synthase domain-like protein [Fomitiporia mediterranea MF3/22]|uniref:riboflavin synthase domain-like protein n=1 Tax=Fomitiporia mediterranea (strain MF3/22) TaxID=694068 RepID=UPI0004409370|nr:riboflavin synthase domain-like protein [Fomitiporia mediterranea MF3/22]EJD05242.1 riboflavin synthase domain-like protein [Fomitiporia mediterranea MF3/22]
MSVEAGISNLTLDGHDQDRDVLILYATETGNALDVAEQIVREARRRLFTVRLSSVDAYPLEELIHESLIIFVVSTTGSGIEPRSMTPMWNMLLRADLPPDIFEDLHFAVFGLGDSAYEKFCWAAKKLSRRMLSLGAREICTRGEGDEQHPLGAEGALDVWMPEVFSTLELLLPPPPGSSFEDVNILPPPRIAISSSSRSSSPMNDDPLADIVGYHLATVRFNDRITAPDWFQDARHMEFDLEDDVIYSPGDVAVIHPVQPASDVESLLESVGWLESADEEIRLSITDPIWHFPETFPTVTTLRQLFTRHLDINAIPRRSFFRMLRHFATDELESEKLREFCTTEGADELYEYVGRVRRTIREVLAEFRSVRIPKVYMFDVFPLLRPRQFSISSSALVHRKQVHLCVAIVRYRTKLKIPRRGVCSTYLAALRPGDTLRINIQKGFLSLPTNSETPIVCVGPGTGIAPMRALIEQRVHDGASDNTLYFGCRSESKDHHYGSQWRALVEAKKLTYRTAFSRDGPEGTKRVYVQDRMREDAERIWEVLGRREGWLYISGSSNKMPAAVKDAVLFAAREVGGLEEEEARMFLKRMQDGGRLFEECWS